MSKMMALRPILAPVNMAGWYTKRAVRWRILVSRTSAPVERNNAFGVCIAFIGIDRAKPVGANWLI